jgi:hypothetical protein
MIDNFYVLETFIKETGREKGSVSGDMALQALRLIKDAVTKEREECAVLMDELGAFYVKVVGHQQVGDILADVEENCAAGDAIRARGRLP